MQIIYGDFETFYSKEYTLRKMTPIEYILDPRWETIGCGVAVGNEGSIHFVEGDGVANLLRRVKRPWAFISYNALFDASILAYRYNIHPDYLIDAMGLVRAVLLHGIRSGRVGLDVVAQYLNIGHKLGTGIKSGYSLELYKETGTLSALKAYCIQDIALMRIITKKLIVYFPKQELRIMDLILKMCTRPQFYSDTIKLSEHLIEVVNAKQQLLQRVNCTRAQLLSSDQFAEILRSFGVEPPTKPSPTDPSKEIFAFAKTDPGMEELVDSIDPDIQALAAARLGIRSTLEEARTQRFIGIGQSTQQALGEAWMPIALRYGAAHTHRFGGEWKINQQNLPARKSKKLRESLYAPPDHVVLEIDAAQIEARLVAWLAGQEDLLREFAKPGSDVYSWFGSDLFKYIISKKTHPIERFNSKTIVLGLGFQMSAKKLLTTITRAAREAGIDQEYTLGQCEVWVNYYRSKFRKIQNTWYYLGSLIPYMADLTYKGKVIERIGPCVVTYQEIILPSGLKIYYDNLSRDDFGEWKYSWGRERRKIYGGKMLENIVQALDRQHVMEAALRIEDRARVEGLGKVRLAHQAHDALIYVPHVDIVDRFKVIAEQEMATPCAWGAGLPLDSETKIGPNYGELE